MANGRKDGPGRSRNGKGDVKRGSRNEGIPVPTIVFLGIITILAVGGLAFYLSQSSGDDGADSDIIEDPQDRPTTPEYLRYEIEDVDGGSFRLEQYKGKVVILDMFATWCSPCEYQISELQKVYDHYSPSEVVILSIDIDERETAEQVRAFRTEHNAPWRFGMASSEVESRFPASSIPTLYYLDKDGVVADKAVGAESYGEVISRVDELL